MPKTNPVNCKRRRLAYRIAKAIENHFIPNCTIPCVSTWDRAEAAKLIAELILNASRARSKAYNQTHKAEIAATAKAYYQAHRPEYAARTKAYQQSHKAEVAKYQKAYRLAHKAEAAAYQKAYRLTHKRSKGTK